MTIYSKQDLYYQNSKKCVRCNNTIPYELRKNLACSRKCANSRKQLPETKQKIGKAQLGHARLKGNTKIPRISVPCDACGNLIAIKTNSTKELNICSNESCKLFRQQYYGIKSARMRVKRSKNEIILYELCNESFGNVGNNTPVVTGEPWDADIILYDYKIAILWNGPWHYKEMNMKNHSLLQVQNRDKIKIKLFEANGWKVLIYEDRYYTPEIAFEEIYKVVAGMGTAPI